MSIHSASESRLLESTHNRRSLLLRSSLNATIVMLGHHVAASTQDLRNLKAKALEEPGLSRAKFTVAPW